MFLLYALAVKLVVAAELDNTSTTRAVSLTEKPDSSVISTTDNFFTTILPLAPVSDVTNVSMSYLGCYKWSAHYDIYLQAIQAFLALTLLCSTSIGGRFCLRICTLCAGACGVWWGSFHCTWDSFLWGALLVFLSVIHLLHLLYYSRPIRFTKEIEDVYRSLFFPLRVSRLEFKRVLDCMKEIKEYKSRELYAHEKVTKVDSLSLVLSGKLVVSQNQRALHIVFPHHFLDSPEWFGVSTDEHFQVSIMSMEDSRILIWHRDKLRLSIMSEPFLQAVFDHILGRDIVHKLMQVSDTMAANNDGTHIINNFDDDCGEKATLVVKKNGDGTGITALLNRQLNGSDPNAWRLVRIDEADKETSV